MTTARGIQPVLGTSGETAVRVGAAVRITLFAGGASCASENPVATIETRANTATVEQRKKDGIGISSAKGHVVV